MRLIEEDFCVLYLFFVRFLGEQKMNKTERGANTLPSMTSIGHYSGSLKSKVFNALPSLYRDSKYHFHAIAENDFGMTEDNYIKTDVGIPYLSLRETPSPKPHTRYLTPQTSNLTPDTSHPIPHTRYLKPDTSHPIPETRYPNQ